MFRKFTTILAAAAFLSSSLGPVPMAQAQPLLGLPEPGMMVNLSPSFQPVLIKGLTVHKENPFLFDFIVDTGQDNLKGEALKKEGEKLIKYFLASLAIPEKDLWVNLSPYEKDRTIPSALSQTEMGRDLLAQDYLLKQITASLIYPEKTLGKSFWDKVYAKTQQMYGSAQVPVNTFNKVWIMADKAEVFERNQTAFVVASHLKVMLEEDYLALTRHAERSEASQHTIASQIVKDIILPELEKEVNTGKNFANLRQITNSLILASWYKKQLKTAILNQIYADKAKVKGIDLQDTGIKEQIYDRYLQAYKKGVFNFIKEDKDPAQASPVPRKYFSGGWRSLSSADLAIVATETPEVDSSLSEITNPLAMITAGVKINSTDAAMSARNKFQKDALLVLGVLQKRMEAPLPVYDDRNYVVDFGLLDFYYRPAIRALVWQLTEFGFEGPEDMVGGRLVRKDKVDFLAGKIADLKNKIQVNGLFANPPEERGDLGYKNGVTTVISPESAAEQRTATLFDFSARDDRAMAASNDVSYRYNFNDRVKLLIGYLKFRINQPKRSETDLVVMNMLVGPTVISAVVAEVSGITQDRHNPLILRFDPGDSFILTSRLNALKDKLIKNPSLFGKIASTETGPPELNLTNALATDMLQRLDEGPAAPQSTAGGSVRLTLVGTPVRAYLSQLAGMFELTRKIVEGKGVYAKGLDHATGEGPSAVLYYRFNPPAPIIFKDLLKQMEQIDGLGISEVMLFETGRDLVPLQFAVRQDHKEQVIGVLAKIHSYFLQIPAKNPSAADLRINLPEVVSQIMKEGPAPAPVRPAVSQQQQAPASPVVPKPVATPAEPRRVTFNEGKENYPSDQFLDALAEAVSLLKNRPEHQSQGNLYYNFNPSEPNFINIVLQVWGQIPRSQFSDLDVTDMKLFKDRLELVVRENDSPEQSVPQLAVLFERIRDLVLKRMQALQGRGSIDGESIIRQTLTEIFLPSKAVERPVRRPVSAAPTVPATAPQTTLLPTALSQVLAVLKEEGRYAGANYHTTAKGKVYYRFTPEAPSVFEELQRLKAVAGSGIDRVAPFDNEDILLVIEPNSKPHLIDLLSADLAMLQDESTTSEDLTYRSHAERMVKYLKMKLFGINDVQYDGAGNYVVDLIGMSFDPINRPVISALTEELKESGVTLIDKGNRLRIQKDRFSQLSSKLDDVLAAIKKNRLFSRAPESAKVIIKKAQDTRAFILPGIAALEPVKTANGQELTGTRGLEIYLRRHLGEDLTDSKKDLAGRFGISWSSVDNILKKPEFTGIKTADKRGRKPNRPKVKGGIDLDTTLLNWSISKDGTGVEMKIDPAMLARWKREGVENLTPVIFRVTSIADIWSLLKLTPPRQILPRP